MTNTYKIRNVAVGKVKKDMEYRVFGRDRRNGLVLVGKGASDGGSVDVDFGDDALYASYTRRNSSVYAGMDHINGGSIATEFRDDTLYDSYIRYSIPPCLS
jgi:hypothetical protein